MDLNFNLVEKQTKGISGGGGLTSIGQSEGALPGIVANAAYSQHNLFGLNQKLNASVAIGQVANDYSIPEKDLTCWHGLGPSKGCLTLSLPAGGQAIPD